MNKSEVLREFSWAVKTDPPGRKWSLSNDGGPQYSKKFYRRWQMDSLQDALEALEIMWQDAGLNEQEVRSLRSTITDGLRISQNLFLGTWIE